MTFNGTGWREPNMIDADVRSVFDSMWHEGYDGKDLALAFVRVAAAVVREDKPEDIPELHAAITGET